MRIGGLQKSSLIDYPDRVCAVVFTQGCNFRCTYCHNPELVLPEKYCACLPEAEILSFLERRKKYLSAVTVTGGEPCLQPDLLEFLREIKTRGFLVKLDTNGSYPEVLDRILKERLADYLSMDVKAPEEKYPAVTGVKVEISRVRKSIEIIMGCGLDHEFKTTVVRDQLDRTDFAAIGRMISGARRYFLQKFVPTKTVAPEFLKKTTYPDAEFADLQALMRRYVPEVGVR